jgi:hypothetical protein
MWEETTTRVQDIPYSFAYHPIKTVGAPGGNITPPAALGSAILAAPIPPIITVVDPMATASTPQLSPIRAAGSPSISTVGSPGGIIGTGAP